MYVLLLLLKREDDIMVLTYISYNNLC